MKKLCLSLMLSLFLPALSTCATINEKVLICGVCKDVEPFLKNMIKNIENLGKEFKEYTVVVYENNSKDNTKHLLKNWASRNSNVKFFTESLSEKELKTISKAREYNDSPCRMELISYARNMVLKEAYKNSYSDYKYLIMCDLDFSSTWDIKAILDSFKTTKSWDAITANGVSRNKAYYDKYALRSKELPLGPEISKEFWNMAKKPLRYSGHDLIEVMSAFGGFGIYKLESIRGIYYESMPNEALVKFYSTILSKPEYRYNPLITSYLDSNSQRKKIAFVNNSGYDQPVCCEHVVFHANMKLKNKARIYINPNLLIFY